MSTPHPGSEQLVLETDALGALFHWLRQENYRLIGPTLRDEAIIYDDIEDPSELPRGWLDEQSGGHYRLRQEGEAWFGYTVGPGSWKTHLHPPKQRLWTTQQTGTGQSIQPEPVSEEKLAFIGVRSCELAAIAIQDKVFLDGPFRDPHYAARRENLFVVAVNCARAGATCFCTSMQTGPRAKTGFDIALTEIDDVFLAECGTALGASALATLPSRPAEPEDLQKAAAATATAEAQITRQIETRDLPDLLKSNPEHPRWAEVAQRCLNCANCTMVCPTCFCTSAHETSDLETGDTARERHWASCFTTDFSYIHDHAVRQSPMARYRNWMTHKLGTWHDQFGMSGCTGCGRCIAWCPVGIDITEEAAAIRGPSGEG